MIVWLALVPLLLLTAHTAINARLLRRPRRDAATTERVAVLLPLRNEADRVTPCLRSLLAQRGVPGLTVHVLDDASTDDTAAVVRAIAAEAGSPVHVVGPPAPDPTVSGRPGHRGGQRGTGRVRLIAGTSPPEGWLGKPNACRRLADDAGDADVLVFVDADVVLAPDAVAGAVELLRRTGVTLLSPYPRIVGAGRLVQPLLQWSWLTFLPLRGMERSPRPSLAAAGGQWLLLDRAGYQRAGGHAAVRGDILEDVGLARAVKRSGGRIALADGSGLATCHMYGSWPELVNGYGKSLWASFGSASGAAAVVVLLLLLYALPALFLVLAIPLMVLFPSARSSPLPLPDGLPAAFPDGSWLAAALAAYLLGVTGRMISAVATGGRVLPDALAHPLSVALFAWLVARSFHLRRHNRLTWRGRPV